ncbi:MAG: hypothetical protein KDA37_02450 [Planctomycetales bacterium]|nr:hypothetical protein [Planctomycetales bacterium]
MRSFLITALCLCATLAAPENPLFAQKPPDRWADAMRAFREQDENSPFPPGNVVFVGSSSIRLWDLKKSFPEMEPTPLNRGFGGSEIADTNRHLDLLVLKHRPRLVVMYAGDNDIAAGRSPQRVHRDFEEFARRVHAALPETRIAYIAIKPSIARWKLAERMKEANALIAKSCEEDDRSTFVDIWAAMLGEEEKPRKQLLRDDGLHMTAAGYAVWVEALQGAMSTATPAAVNTAP